MKTPEQQKRDEDWSMLANQVVGAESGFNQPEQYQALQRESDALKAKLEASESALDGRLGIGNPDAVRQACQEYVAAEDQLPEWCDGEDYRLSTAVRSVVAKLEELQRENAELKALLNKTAAEASFGYCAAWVKDGVAMPRTGYGDGWNAAMAKITKILDHQDDDAWVIKEAYDRVEIEATEARKKMAILEEENTQLHKAVEAMIEWMESANSCGDVEFLDKPIQLRLLEILTRLKAFVTEEGKV